MNRMFAVAFWLTVTATASGCAQNQHGGESEALQATITALSADRTDRGAEDPEGNTATSDTPAGTILEIDQTWRRGGLELRLTGRDTFTDMIRAYFRLTNKTDADRVMTYGPESFSATDNLGNRLQIGGISYNFRPLLQTGCDARELVLHANEAHSVLFPCPVGSWDGVAVGADLTNPAITEIVVSVSGISSIDEARWRIPIGH